MGDMGNASRVSGWTGAGAASGTTERSRRSVGSVWIKSPEEEEDPTARGNPLQLGRQQVGSADGADRAVPGPLREAVGRRMSAGSFAA